MVVGEGFRCRGRVPYTLTSQHWSGREGEVRTQIETLTYGHPDFGSIILKLKYIGIGTSSLMSCFLTEDETVSTKEGSCFPLER